MKSTQPSQFHRSQFRYLLTFVITLALLMAATGNHPASSAPGVTFQYWVDVFGEGGSEAGCLDGTGGDTCGLRSAVNLANAGSVADSYYIYLSTGTYTLSSPGAGEDLNIYGDLDIYGATVYIQGHGVNDTILTQSGTFDRIIDHRGDHNLTLINLTIQGGNLPTGQGGGGGLRSLATGRLSLSLVAFKNNTVLGSDSTDRGGGVYMEDTTLGTGGYTIYEGNTACHGGGMAIHNSIDGIESSFTNPLFDDNVATCGNGGGLHVTGYGNLTFDSPSFADNNAKSGAGYYDSAATEATMTDLMCYGNEIDTGGTGAGCLDVSGDVEVDESMIFSNVGSSGPGGVWLKTGSRFTLTDSKMYSNSGGSGGALKATYNTTALLQRVQITGNLATNGGAISISTDGDIDLENVTIANNDATEYGGGLYLYHNTSTDLNHVTLANNIVGLGGKDVYIDEGTWSSKNSIFYVSSGTACAYYGTHNVTTHGRNIISDASCELTDGSDMPSTDPLLDALDAYDSTMLTMPPLPGSPAIDGAIVSDPVTTDQRGYGRFDGDHDGITKSDIGAHEVETPYYLPLIKKP